VLMTRCMFGAVWIEDPHHPVVRALLETGQGLLLQADTDEQAVASVTLLRRAREEGSGRSGLQALYNALSTIIVVIEERIEGFKDFQDSVTMACDLVKRVAGKANTDMEVALAGLPGVIASIRMRDIPSEGANQALTMQHFGHLVFRELKRGMEGVAGSADAGKLLEFAGTIEARLKKMGLVQG